jgi:hypothetical protein
MARIGDNLWFDLCLNRDLSKTDYTYAKSFSYNRRIDRLKASEWSVPNMSRKSVTSTVVKSSSHSKSTSSSLSLLEVFKNSINSSQTQSQTSERESSVMSDTKRSPKKKKEEQMFTRSNCLGGSQCGMDCSI